jgi:hypothetical protein
LTRQAAARLFSLSRMHVSAEDHYPAHACLLFVDFLEALSRVAGLRMLPTRTGMQASGCAKLRQV